MKVIYLYYNVFVIFNVAIFALELVDDNKILVRFSIYLKMLFF